MRRVSRCCVWVAPEVKQRWRGRRRETSVGRFAGLPAQSLEHERPAPQGPDQKDVQRATRVVPFLLDQVARQKIHSDRLPSVLGKPSWTQHTSRACPCLQSPDLARIRKAFSLLFCVLSAPPFFFAPSRSGGRPRLVVPIPRPLRVCVCSRGGLCGLTKVCTPLFTWIQHSSVQVLMLLPHVLSFPLLYDSTERGSRPPRVLSSSPSEIHTCTAQNIITVGVEITVLYSEKKIECGTLMAGKKKLCVLQGVCHTPSVVLCEIGTLFSRNRNFGWKFPFGKKGG